MTDIVELNTRFYDGLDPLTGRERRPWIPIGHDREEAETVAARLDSERIVGPPPRRGTVTVGEFALHDCSYRVPHSYVDREQATTRPRNNRLPLCLVHPSLQQPGDRRHAAASASFGSSRRPLRTARRDRRPAGSRSRTQTIAEVHMMVRAALDDAAARELVSRNVARHVRGRRRLHAQAAAGSWTALELNQFLAAARPQRLYRALHLAAHTGMRRGEVVGLKWSDLDPAHSRLSISRSLQNVGSRRVEFGVKTRSNRRTVELDYDTSDLLISWRRQLQRTTSLTAPITGCCNTSGRFLNRESITPLFDRIVRRNEMARIRFHDLRHTHASLLVADPIAIKVVSERLGHAHPRADERDTERGVVERLEPGLAVVERRRVQRGDAVVPLGELERVLLERRGAFTIYAYQHLLPGMSASVPEQFAALVATAGR